MIPKRNWRYLYLPAVFLVAAVMSLSDSGPGSAKVTQPGVRSSAGPVPDLTGIWVGMWEDTRFFVSDTLGLTAAVNGPNVQMNGTIGMAPFFLPDEAATMAGTIVVDTLDFTFSSPTISGSARIVGNDVQNGVGTVGGALGFGGFTFTGTVTATLMSFDFVFDSPGGGAGVITLANIVPVESSTWGAIKARYGVDK